MMPKALRKKAASLLVAALTALSATLPADAPGKGGRRTDKNASGVAPEHSVIDLLLLWLAKAGGAMDPNGNPHGKP